MLTAEPAMFIKAVTVKLDTYTGGDIEAPGAPLWLKSVSYDKLRPTTHTRVYSWMYAFLQALLATPDMTIPYVQSWFMVLGLVTHIKVCRVYPLLVP